MASISNLMVTPPSEDAKKRFIDFSDSNFLNSLHSKTLAKRSPPKWYTALCKFHNDRVLEVSSTIINFIRKTKEDLEAQLSIEIKQVKTSFKPNTVCIVPKKPEVLDPLLQDWALPKDCKCRFSGSETFLCVSNLPPEVVDDETFLKFVSKFGPVVNAFLIYHHLTDDLFPNKSLEVGLVEYCSREVACQARNLLHRNRGIFCDWLDYRLVTYTCLYPKCLMARVPDSDEENLRKDFGVVETPMYCQIIPGHDMVLAEYSTPEAAIFTQHVLRSESGRNFSVHLCNPGKSALKLREKMLADLQEAQKVEPSALPQFQFSQLPILLGKQCPSSEPSDVPSSSKVSNPLESGLPCTTNAFAFGLPCSPISENKDQSKPSFVPGPINAFDFPLPCSPIVNILRLTKNVTAEEEKIANDNFPILRTPPCWKNFSLMSLSMTPDRVEPKIEALPSLSSAPVSPCLRTPPRNRSAEIPFETTDLQTEAEVTPVRKTQVNRIRQQKRLLADSDDENNNSERKEDEENVFLKKRLVLGELDTNGEALAWHLDSTWAKIEHSLKAEDVPVLASSQKENDC